MTGGLEELHNITAKITKARLYNQYWIWLGMTWTAAGA
jgi:hypothetical protein